jgi:hypothetical protein
MESKSFFVCLIFDSEVGDGEATNVSILVRLPNRLLRCYRQQPRGRKSTHLDEGVKVTSSSPQVASVFQLTM